MITFGERFKALRLEHNITQKDLADKFFLNYTSISKYENNKAIPELDLLQRIADYFDVTVDYLLCRTDNKNSNVYKSDFDGHAYTVEIDKGVKTKITQDDLQNMIKKLKAVGFDVNKLLEKENDSN